MEGKKLYGFSYSDKTVDGAEKFNQISDELYSAPSDRLVSGAFDESVEKCIQYASSVQNREMLERLAFVLFSGPRSRKYFRDDDLKSASVALLLLFSYKSLKISDVTFVLRLCFQNWKKAVKRSNRNFYAVDRTLSPHVPWTFEGIDSEDEIIITHAGGFHHINAFLQKKSFGYTLENGGVGIQVNPTMATHAKCLVYAERTSPSDHLDTPAILLATIKTKFLHRANNSYEAGLRSEHLEHLQNVQVIKLPYTWLGNNEDIEESIKKIGIEIQTSIETHPSCFGLEYRLENLHRLMTTNSEKNEAYWREIYKSSYAQIKTKLDQTTLEKLTSFTL